WRRAPTHGEGLGSETTTRSTHEEDSNATQRTRSVLSFRCRYRPSRGPTANGAERLHLVRAHPVWPLDSCPEPQRRDQRHLVEQRSRRGDSDETVATQRPRVGTLRSPQ